MPADNINEANIYNPLISIIVPVFNTEKYLKRCLLSIQDQEYENIEVIIIDDGSTDRSVQICEQFVASDIRFKLYKQENAGVSIARNTGLDIVKGEYLLFIDSDDYIQKCYIKRLWLSMRMARVDMVICDYRQECQQTNEKDIEHYTSVPGKYTRISFINQIAKCPGAHYFGVLWNKIYKTDLIKDKELKFNPELSLGEDFVFNMEYLSTIDSISVIPDKLYIYSWNNPSSLTHCTKKIEKQLKERLVLYQAYENLFRREKLDQRWRYKLHYYMLKAYFEETKALGQNDQKYQKQFYQAYISDNGIGKIEFQLFYGLKKMKHLMKFQFANGWKQE